MKHLLIVILLLMACDPTYLDEGRDYRDGLELYSAPPLGVQAEPDIRGFVLIAVPWWSAQIGQEVAFSPTPTPDITMAFGHVPAPDYDPETLEGDVGGIANIDYSLHDGLIIGCDIIISSDLRGFDDAVLEVVKHEIGHCLALADDPHSLDLNSIMSDPGVWRGEVTPGDRAIILEDLQRM